MGRRLLQLNVTESVSLSYQIDTQKKLLQDMKNEYNNNNCISEVESSRQEVVGAIVSEYSSYDKQRIEAESIYERNKRVFFGAVVLIFGLALIMTLKKSKK